MVSDSSNIFTFAPFWTQCAMDHKKIEQLLKRANKATFIVKCHRIWASEFRGEVVKLFSRFAYLLPLWAMKRNRLKKFESKSPKEHSCEAAMQWSRTVWTTLKGSPMELSCDVSSNLSQCFSGECIFKWFSLFAPLWPLCSMERNHFEQICKRVAKWTFLWGFIKFGPVVSE